MSSGNAVTQRYSGGIPIYHGPRTSANVVSTLPQESTEFLNGVRRTSNSNLLSEAKKSLINMNYEESYQFQKPLGCDETLKIPDAFKDNPTKSTSPAYSGFGNTRGRTSGVIRIDTTKDYTGNNLETGRPQRVTTFSKTKNLIEPPLTTHQQQSIMKPAYVVNQDSKGLNDQTLRAPASVITMHSRPAKLSRTDVPTDNPPPIKVMESELPRGQRLSDNFGSHAPKYSFTSSMGTTGKPQCNFVSADKFPIIDTLPYQKSTFAGVKNNAAGKIAGPATTTLTDSEKATHELTLTKITSADNSNNEKLLGKNTQRKQAEKIPKKVLSKGGYGFIRACDRNTLCCLIMLLFVLLLVAASFLVYFANAYDMLSDASKVVPEKKAKIIVTTEVPSLPPITSTTIDETPPTCVTAECTVTAGEVLKKMNLSVDPCEDFYEYACGGWIRNNYIPPNKINYGIASQIAETNQKVIYQALIRPDNTDQLVQDLRGNYNDLTTAEKKAKVFFKSCMDTDRINLLGAAPMLDMIRDAGGWNAISPWDMKSWNFDSTLFVIHGEQSTSALFSTTIRRIGYNGTSASLEFGLDSLMIPRLNFYINDVGARGTDPVVIAYKKLIGRILELFGATNIDATVDDIYNFEKRIAKIISQVSIQSEQMTVKQLQALCPKIKWLKFVKKLMRKQRVNSDTSVYVQSKLYLEKLQTLLSNSSARSQNNYMVWRMVVSRIHLLSSEFRDALKEYSEALYVQSPEPPVWQQCMKDVDTYFKLAATALFIRQSFDLDRKNKVETMVTNLQDAFRENLKTVYWMDNRTKASALEKLKAMTFEVGYPDYLLSDSKYLNDEYNFEVNEFTYFKNILNAVKYRVRSRVDEAFGGTSVPRWESLPQSINAFYSPSKNRIIFPAGLLQPPFYAVTNPDSFNYGGLGSMIGHEVTHGYDTLGQTKDKYGRLNPWWSSATASNYAKNFSCLIDSYNDYYLGRYNVKGSRTVKENIADIAGLKLSYLAYQNWLRNNKRTIKKLPAPQLSDKKLFFLGFAQIWCMKRLPSSYIYQFSHDHHSPEKFRVQGAVSHTKEFAEAFECAPGTPMNPRKKCGVW